MPFVLLAFILTGCSSVQYQSPEDYYKMRQNQLREDSINWGPSSNNNLLDSQDGNTYYNRTVEIFGAKY